MRERYTAVCPEPVILAMEVSSDSLRTTPTSATDRGILRQPKISPATSKRQDELRNSKTSPKKSNCSATASLLLRILSGLQVAQRRPNVRFSKLLTELVLSALRQQALGSSLFSIPP